MGRQRATQTRTAEIDQQGRTSTSQQPQSLGSDLSNPLLQFQQTIGNRAVGRILQAKLRVSQPGDNYEQEADHVADMVMRMQEPRRAAEVDRESGAPGKIATGFVQRKCAVCASGQGICPKCEEEGKIQRQPLAAGLTPLLQRQPAKPEEEEEDELLQSKEIPGHTPEGAPKVAANLRALRGGGQPLPPSVRSFFEPRFGENFSGVRVHADGRAAETARDLQARAFTMGRDVVFGPGEYEPESAAGRRLLAHELTHVVQQSQRHPTLQAKIQRQANDVTSDAVATPERAGPGLIVDDSAVELNPGQMRKSEFLAELRAEVCAAADKAMAETGQNTEGCPYLDAWFDFYREKNARHIERSLRKFAPEAAPANTAREYITVVTARVQRSVAVWARTGEITDVPEELRSAIIGGSILSAFGSVASGIGRAVSSLVGGISKGFSAAASLFFKARAGGPNNVGDPQAIQAQLGEGQPLNGDVRSRFGSVFGQNFSKVHVHTDSNAALLSDQLNARAFTVGEHIAFGSGEYQPGTLTGDALIAHELAHVEQQSRGATSPMLSPNGRAISNSLEEDADLSAVGAVFGLWKKTNRALANSRGIAAPRLKSGLGLQRCGSQRAPTRGSVTTPPTAGAAQPGGESRTTSSTCPTSIEIASTTNMTPGGLDKGYRTAYGITSVMRVLPNNVNWDGIGISERVSLASSTCPEAWNLCTGASTFIVGAERYSTILGNLPAQRNHFYDFHTSRWNRSRLHDQGQNPAGMDSCQVVCAQEYLCGGNVIGRFSITRTFRKDMYGGREVTIVDTTKAE